MAIAESLETKTSREYQTILEQLRVALLPEKSPSIQITNIWETDQGRIYGIELHHHDNHCFPPSLCKGLIKTHFLEGAKGFKTSYCWGCGEETNIEQGYTQDELGISLLSKPPNKTLDLSHSH